MKLSLVTSFIPLFAFAIAATGCAAQPGAAEENGASTDEALSGVDVPNPSDAYFASITANGSGCPAGTWNASISPDGKEFAVAFSAYEASISPGEFMTVKDCTLALDFKSPKSLSFAVDDFYYQGLAFLDSPGMSARQSARYYFMGNPVPARENYSDMQGPFDDIYLFHDTFLPADLVWSPCGSSRRLNAQSRLIINNNAKKSGSGYLNTTTVAGEATVVFRWNLSWRSCES